MHCVALITTAGTRKPKASNKDYIFSTSPILPHKFTTLRKWAEKRLSCVVGEGKEGGGGTGESGMEVERGRVGS